MTIIAEITGRRHVRTEVLRWEDRRIDAAARKLGVAAPAPGDVGVRRQAFWQTKVELGAEEILRRLDREVRWADRVARAQARVSPRRRRSIIDLHVTGGSATAFVDFFSDAVEDPTSPSMVRACPDHFLLRAGAGGQEVLETNGSSPLAAMFVIDYEDVSSLVTAADPDFPHQLAGVARPSDGRALGGVRHQFRDTAEGFHARLTVEFPLPTLPTMIAGHRWHLACEFSNWIEDARLG